MSHVFVDSSRLFCFLIAPPGHHCVRLLSVRAVVYLSGLPRFCGCAQCSQSTHQPSHCSCHAILGRMRCITCIAFGSLHVLLARLTISPCTFLCADNQLTHLSKCCFAPLGCFLVCTPAPRLIVLLMRSLDCHAFSEMSCSSLDLQSQVRLIVTTRSSPQQELQRCVVPDTNVSSHLLWRAPHYLQSLPQNIVTRAQCSCELTAPLHSGAFRTLS